jgi:hypothetical protein
LTQQLPDHGVHVELKPLVPDLLQHPAIGIERADVPLPVAVPAQGVGVSVFGFDEASGHREALDLDEAGDHVK